MYHYLEAKWALDDIGRRRLKISKINDMNDPYEWKCVRSEDELSQMALEQTSQTTFDRLGVICFGRSWKSILMWSHYGDKHKGICLGFDVADEVIRKVRYVSEVEVVGNFKDLPPADLKIVGTRIIDKLFEAKYAGWSYEDEVRVNPTREEMDDDAGMYFLPFGDVLRLKEVIAGVKCITSRKEIEEALQGYSDEVKIVKAGMAPNRFEIVVDEHGFVEPSAPGSPQDCH